MAIGLRPKLSDALAEMLEQKRRADGRSHMGRNIFSQSQPRFETVDGILVL